MHPTSRLIEQLLQDDSFPSMVILDGVWGEGKTYFAKNTLLKELKKDGYNTFHLSLTGISNISDYRDRLLSVSFEKTETTTRFLKRHSQKIGTFFDSMTEQNNIGLIGGVLAGSAGIVREKLLHNLDNIRFIIDDLDRVEDPKLCNLIVGESLQLADSETKKIQFVFVVNESKSCLSSDLREKAFCGKSTLNMRIDDLIKIAFENKKLHQDFLIPITKAIETKNIKNLRILKRLANKAEKVNNIILGNDEVDQKTSFSYLAHNLTLICHYLYQEGYSSDKIWSLVNDSPWDLPDTSDGVKKELCLDNELKTINYGISEELVQFCAFESSSQLTLHDLGRLPIKTSDIDKLLFSYPEQLAAKDFLLLSNNLKRFIFEDKSVPLSQWFEACVYYEQQINLSFISDDSTGFIDSLENLCATKDFDPSEDNSRWHRLSFEGTHQKIGELYEKYNKLEISRTLQFSYAELVIEITNSWNKIGQNFYDDYNLKPFFNVMTDVNWKKCIEKWSPHDFGTFSRDIYNRYRPSNINDFFNCEYDALKSFHNLILVEIEKTPIGQKKGAMEKARRALAKAIEKLTP
ncbi:MAG: hypothetical protein ACJA2U_000209 [Marinomonas primoryensis]|jgi:hypothetical protein